MWTICKMEADRSACAKHAITENHTFNFDMKILTAQLNIKKHHIPDITIT